MSSSNDLLSRRIEDLTKLLKEQRKPMPRPDKILDIMYSTHLFNIIAPVLKLRLFDILTEPHSIQELSEKLGLNQVILNIICRILVCLGLLKEVDGRYVNTELSNIFLVSNSL